MNASFPRGFPKQLRSFRSAAVLAVAAALATGCASGDTPAADDGGPIYISVLADITGKGAFFGEAISKAATFSVDRINSSGGIAGRQIEVSIEDTTSDPGRAASLMTDAAGGDADAVVFGVLSEEALTIAPLAQDAGIPMIAIQAAANGVVETGDQIWRITPRRGTSTPPTPSTSRSSARSAPRPSSTSPTTRHRSRWVPRSGRRRSRTPGSRSSTPCRARRPRPT